VLRNGKLMGTGTHTELLRRDDTVGELYRSVVARTTNAAEPEDAEELDDARTGSINTLWREAVHTGAIPTRPIRAAGQGAAGRGKDEPDAPAHR
jgi:hypothetical protein